MTATAVHPRRLVMHDIPLALEPEPLIVRVTLPRDLTEAEAQRLCEVIRCLAMPATEGGSR